MVIALKYIVLLPLLGTRINNPRVLDLIRIVMSYSCHRKSWGLMSKTSPETRGRIQSKRGVVKGVSACGGHLPVVRCILKVIYKAFRMIDNVENIES